MCRLLKPFYSARSDAGGWKRYRVGEEEDQIPITVTHFVESTSAAVREKLGVFIVGVLNCLT